MLRRTLAKTALAAPLLATGLATTMGRASAQTPSTITGAFDVGPGGAPGNFNPMTASAGYTWLNMYLEPLVIYDAKLEAIVGCLASSYSVTPDLLSYTFKLTDTVWHDGKPFTSADVKFSFELAKNAASGSNFTARLASISSVETPDARTAVVKLSAPNAALIDTLTKVMMLPAHALAAIPVADMARNAWWSTTPIGTGPFKFTRYSNGQFVALAANESYRLGKPKVDRVINRYFDNTAGAVAALRAGEIQFTYVEADDVANFQGNPGYRIIEGNSYVVNYLGFNNEVSVWKDTRVRQAVMHAIDRAAIIKSLYGGAAVTANCGYVAPAVVPAGIDSFAYDPALAKKLLADAGWEKINGAKPIALVTYYNTPLATNVLAAIQAMLAAVGINVVPRTVDVPTYNSIVYAQTPDHNSFAMVYAGFQNGPDPSIVNVALNTKQVPPAGANIMRVRSEALTGALDAALGETDDTKRNSRYQQVCRVMNAELPWGTLWVTSRYGVASTKLADFVWTPAPAGGPYAAHPEKWSIGG
jgi:peptide/nickel transport system substrate-binding protein